MEMIKVLLRNIFLEKEEHKIAVLGNTYLQNYLRTGKEEGGFCIVSNCRLYMKGTIYQKTGRHYRKCRQAQIVPLSEIQSCDERIKCCWRRRIPIMEFVCRNQILAMEIGMCSEYECQEFQKHLCMAIAYERRQGE